MNEDGEGFDTRALHAGEEGDPWSRAVTSPLILSTNFRTSPDESSFSAHAMKEGDPYFYSRWGTPTVRALERKLAALEGAEDAVCFASGMGAAASFLLHRLKAGDHLVLSDVCYAGVPEFAFATLPKLGVEVTAADFSDVSEIERAIRPNTKVIWAESPCNPIFRLTDLAAVSKVAKGAGADFLVDSTIATPLYTRPLELGADFVMHSLTKYLNGHGDALGGVILGKAEDIQALRKDALIHLGAVLSPFNAWLIMRGVHTLAPRMRVHSENALQVAAFLEGHRAVKRVIYPGLPSHPQHQLAKRQMAGFS
ncbi:MAG: trans-sulfuration enzyme family protein, partial [Caulobacteraceae bacterium]